MIELVNESVPYISVMIAIVACIFLVSGIDDILMDIFFAAWRVYRRVFFQRRHRRITREMLMEGPQKRIAMMIPAWQEASVIRETLDEAVRHIAYDNYQIFVGTYPNDPETRSEVEAASRDNPGRIRLVDVGHDGPTTKADCLNAVIKETRRVEQDGKGEFEIFVLDDAEDMIPRYSLLVFNYLVPRKDFVQLPVFPAKVAWNQFTAGHYMDEFAQLHLMDMRTREWLTGAIPSAGVGAALSRRALELALEANQGQVFSEDTLTEDYELPLHLIRARAREAFIEPGEPVRSEIESKVGQYETLEEEYPYIRSFFPSSLPAAVRQKSRWVLGISLQGWEHLGWKGSPAQVYMFWRDRKVLIGNLANFLGYFLVFFTIAIWLSRWGLTGSAEFPNVVPPGSFIWNLLIINLVIMAIQLVIRFACTLRIYGLVHAFLSPLRAVWGNYINFLATVRALFLFFRAKLTRGSKIPWEKTEHHPRGVY